jgi:hypothetical protein
MSGNHKGGWEEPVYGIIEDHDVTASFGTGSNEGETLLADGHVDGDIRRGAHDHYGSGEGRNDNGTDRGIYTGPGGGEVSAGDRAEQRAAMIKNAQDRQRRANRGRRKR